MNGNQPASTEICSEVTIGKLRVHGLVKGSNKEARQAAILLFLFSFSTVLPQILYLTHSDSSGIALKVVLILVFFSLVIRRVVKTNKRTSVAEILIGIGVFITQIFSNWFFSLFNTTITLMDITDISTFLLYYLMFMAMLSDEKIDKHGVLIFANCYKIFILYACILNIVTNYHLILHIGSMSSAYEYNFSSFFSNRNTFALFLLVEVMLCLYRMRIRKTWSDKIVLCFVFGNVFLTFSRTAMLGTLVFCVTFYLIVGGGTFLKRLLTVIMASFGLLIIFNVLGLAGFLQKAAVRANVGTTGRTDIWQNVWAIFINHNLLFGVGESIANLYTIHNTILTTLSYGGIFLALFYVHLLIRTAVMDIKILKYDREVGAFFVSAFATYLVIMNTETVMPFMSDALNSIYTVIIVLLPRYYLNSIITNQTPSPRSVPFEYRNYI